MYDKIEGNNEVSDIYAHYTQLNIINIQYSKGSLILKQLCLYGIINI